MKKFAKALIQGFLSSLAKIWIWRKDPKIVGITGSCGKTSIKEAVYTVLKSKFRVKKSEGSYNTEFGMPLAILGLKSGYSSPLLWIKIISQAIYRAFFDPEKVDILILEMGVDKPHDMDALLKLATPHVAVFANVKPVHLAEGQFKDLDEIFHEKSKIVRNLPSPAAAILNIDDLRVKRLVNEVKCNVFTYSAVHNHASFPASFVETTEEGLEFDVSHSGEKVHVKLPVLGEHHVYVFLPAFACGILSGMTISEIASAISNFDLPPGRMNVIAGMNDSMLIDSSYNASPDATVLALEILKKVGKNAGRKIAVLGNMNELGAYTEREHRRVGKKASECCDLLIAVGEYTKALCDEARVNGFPDEKIFWFENVFAAISYLRDNVQRGDVILVKGSQNKVRLEILVKELMRDKERASELLVRQGKEWDNIW